MPRVRLGDPSFTLGQMRQDTCWCWVYCGDEQNCRHHRPIALAPFIIRWGSDAPVSLLRTSLRCSACGHRGVTLTVPSWGGREVGTSPFPVKRV